MSKRAYNYFQKYSQRSGHYYTQEVFSYDNYSAPAYVTAMPRLHEHLCYLLYLFKIENPVLRLI